MFVDNLHTQLLFDEEELTSPPDTKKLGTKFSKAIWDFDRFRCLHDFHT